MRRKIKGSTLVEIVVSIALLTMCAGIALSGFTVAGGFMTRARDNEAYNEELSAQVQQYLSNGSYDSSKYELFTVGAVASGIDGKMCAMEHKESGFRYVFFVVD